MCVCGGGRTNITVIIYCLRATTIYYFCSSIIKNHFSTVLRYLLAMQTAVTNFIIFPQKGLIIAPGSRKGVGRIESLVHTVCACARNSPLSGNLYSSVFFRVTRPCRTHPIPQQQSYFYLHCNQFLSRSRLA